MVYPKVAQYPILEALCFHEQTFNEQQQAVFAHLLNHTGY